MKILYIAATEFEIRPFIDQMSDSEFLITGIGSPATIYYLTKRLNQSKYDLVIQAGIAGSFGQLQPGEVAFVKSDCFADLGICEENVLHSLFDKGFLEKDEFPFKNGKLENDFDGSDFADIPVVRAVTVNLLTDDPVYTSQLHRKFDADLESMEGAAFHYVCLLENVQFAQLRSVSNMVGNRDKTEWKIAEAVEKLNDFLKRLHHRLKDKE